MTRDEYLQEQNEKLLKTMLVMREQLMKADQENERLRAEVKGLQAALEEAKWSAMGEDL